MKKKKLENANIAPEGVKNNEQEIVPAKLPEEGKKLTRKEKKLEKQKQEKAEAKALAQKEYQEHLASTVLNNKTPFAISEAYKATRTNILFSLKDKKGCKKIAVTSANPSEGKSTNAVNLAVSFAQMGERVVVVDGDMRKPTIHKYFGIKNKKGLSNILGGFETISDCIYHDDATGLEIITSGHIPPNPAELLSSREMDAFLESLSGKYDYVIIDSPPVNVVTDVTVLSKKIDGVVIVIRHNATQKRDLERCMNSLKFAEAKIIGFLLNSVEWKVYEGKYSYRGAYKRGYKKRYGYSKYGYGRYGYDRYGKQYGYGRYDYGKYIYSKYSYGYGYGYNYDENAEEEPVTND